MGTVVVVSVWLTSVPRGVGHGLQVFPKEGTLVLTRFPQANIRIGVIGGRADRVQVVNMVSRLVVFHRCIQCYQISTFYATSNWPLK